MSDGEGTFGITEEQVDSLRYSRSTSAQTMNPFESDGLICQMVEPKSRVLDVGCGTGTLMKVLRQIKDVDIVGIEPNEARALEAEKANLNVIQGYVSNDLLRSLGEFDTIIFADVLEHIVDPASMLEMIKPFLRPSGFVIASIPNVAHWTIRMSLLRGHFNYRASGLMDATHLRWFTAKTARLLFESSGFAIDSLRYSSGSWLPEYRYMPLRLVPNRFLPAVVRSLTRAMPTVFGCQHVIRARKL